MTRQKLTELLKNNGIEEVSKELLNAILDEVGAETETYKNKISELEKDIETKSGDIKSLEETIKSSSEDADKIKELNDKIAEYEKAETERKQQEEANKIEEALKGRFEAVVKDKQFINDYTKNALYSEFKNKLNDETFKGKGDSDIFEDITKNLENIYKNKNTNINIGGANDKSEDVKQIDNIAREVMGLPPIK